MLLRGAALSEVWDEFLADELVVDVLALLRDVVLSPSFLYPAAGLVTGFIVLLLLKGFFIMRARKLMMDSIPAGGEQSTWQAMAVDSRITTYTDMTLRQYWAGIRRPLTHTACWFIAGSSRELLEELLAVSEDAPKFGRFLPAIAWKTMGRDVENPVAMWEHLMTFADRPSEEHERLAAPGYTLTVSLISVEQDIPLEYAAAIA